MAIMLVSSFWYRRKHVADGNRGVIVIGDGIEEYYYTDEGAKPE